MLVGRDRPTSDAALFRPGIQRAPGFPEPSEDAIERVRGRIRCWIRVRAGMPESCQVRLEPVQVESFRLLPERSISSDKYTMLSSLYFSKNAGRNRAATAVGGPVISRRPAAACKPGEDHRTGLEARHLPNKDVITLYAEGGKSRRQTHRPIGGAHDQ